MATNAHNNVTTTNGRRISTTLPGKDVHNSTNKRTETQRKTQATMNIQTTLVVVAMPYMAQKLMRG